ncbi:hypothetical protein VE01_08488 [Pseudogymnoascus verrucosus]|uniref:O-acyltransferase n=1 Tax=Pseudogymnoascus verrucosus TaxID=342668 RepID=A0A1B8GDB1_9PEZI|nr:uncharacterized protein VE01_08488 [Pseudogymnoascus verrucosus]OBT93818.1 hypothetical protein VE01_08488 [Pseudogymnoascus verrucosus]
MATAVNTRTTTVNSTLTQRSARSNGRAQSAQTPLNSASVPAIDVPEVSRRLRIKKKYRHVAAVHSRPQNTVLSHDAAEVPSFLGFRNLMVIVLVVGNLRLMIENFNKYGVLICLRCHNYKRHDVFIGATLLLIIPCHLFAAYIIELAAAKHAKRQLAASNPRSGAETPTPTEAERKKFNTAWELIAWLHGLNATLCLLITSVVVYNYIHHPLIGTLSEVHAIIVWLKTASYAFTNRDLRHAYLHPSKRIEDALPDIYLQCPYPQNISLSNLTYFWWAPTLVYQPVYPRSPRIRWSFVAKRLAEVFGLSVFIWVASAQYAAPLLRNSLDKMASLELISILERLMKLSTISLVVWLAGFFALFQSFLNALAEVTRFGDRDFYSDWWNSDSVGAYWRTWNKPVYQFMKRHVFSPLIGRGWSPWAASVAVFALSAVLHELLVGVPTHNIIGVAALGMLAQLPLIKLTAPFERAGGHYGKLVGNTVFWVSFVLIGQPLAALLYFFAWEAKYGSHLKGRV